MDRVVRISPPQAISNNRSVIMGIAILWVMLLHLEIRTNITFVDWVLSIGYVGVDIFFFLSGLGLFFSLSRKENSIKDYYIKRFFRIFPEYWSVLFILFFIEGNYRASDFFHLAIKATTIGYWIHNAPFFLWYISAIVACYIMMPLYMKLWKRYGVVIPCIAILVGMMLILGYALISVVAFNNVNVGGPLILSISRIPIFIIGTLFGSWLRNGKCIKVSNITIYLLGTLFVLSLISLYYFPIYLPAYLWTCSLYFIPFIVICPVLCVLLSRLLDKIHYSATFFSRVGSISLELYLIHEYIFDHDSFFFISTENIYLSTVIKISISFFFAYLLFIFNKYVLQNLCKMILGAIIRI